MISNTEHNIVHQLSETIDSFWRMDTYIEDARKDQMPQLAKFWEGYKATLEKQVAMLQEQLKEQCGK